jgi:hypothetical protein
MLDLSEVTWKDNKGYAIEEKRKENLSFINTKQTTLSDFLK